MLPPAGLHCVMALVQVCTCKRWMMHMYCVA